MDIEKEITQISIDFIPRAWQIKSLGDFGKFSKGQGIRKDESLSGIIPCIRYGELYTKHSDVIKAFYSFISKEIALSSKRLKNGDILFAGSGETKQEIGKCAAFIDNIEAYAGGDIVIFSPTNVNSLFLGYILNSPFVQKQKASKGQGDAVVHISAAQLADIVVPLPRTLKEQTAIASALSDTDALISSLGKLIAKKRYIKQGAMQELLKPTEEWKVKRLSEILRSTQLGGNYQNSERVNNYPLIKMGNIQRGEISLGKIEYIKEGAIDERDKLNAGDVLLNTRNTLDLVGKVAIWRSELPVAYFNSNLIRLKFNSLFVADDMFMNYLFNTINIITKLKEIATGTTSVAAIYTKDLTQLEIPLPPLSEQMRISAILNDMTAEINALESKLSKYRQIKTGMMQTLLTGQIRLV